MTNADLNLYLKLDGALNYLFSAPVTVTSIRIIDSGAAGTSQQFSIQSRERRSVGSGIDRSRKAMLTGSAVRQMRRIGSPTSSANNPVLYEEVLLKSLIKVEQFSFPLLRLSFSYPRRRTEE